MRKTISNQEEFVQLVLRGKKIVDTDFTFNMAIGTMDGFPTNRIIRFVNCTFKDVSIQFLNQNEVSFAQATIQRLIVCDGGRSVLLKIVDSTVQSITFRDGGSVDDFKIAGSNIIEDISFRGINPRLLTISKSSRIARLAYDGCQNDLEYISITNSEISVLFFEYSQAGQVILKNGQIASIEIHSSEFNEFSIKSIVNNLLIDGDGLRRYTFQLLVLSGGPQSGITLSNVNFTILNLIGLLNNVQFHVSDVTIANLTTKRSNLNNALFNNTSIASLTS